MLSQATAVSPEGQALALKLFQDDRDYDATIAARCPVQSLSTFYTLSAAGPKTRSLFSNAPFAILIFSLKLICLRSSHST